MKSFSTLIDSIDNFFLGKSDNEIFSLDNMSVPNDKIAYYYFSGGTTGKPKVIPFTESEWKNRSVYRAQCYKKVGITKKNRIAILLPFGPWVAGPSVQSALIELGCTFFPIGLLKEDEEFLGFIKIMRDHKIDTIISMPSTVETLISIYESDKNSVKLNLKKVITSGEYLTKNTRLKVNKLFGGDCLSSYASSEFFVGVECSKNENCYHFDPKILNITDNSSTLFFTHNISEAIKIKEYSLGDTGKTCFGDCVCGISWPMVCITGRKKGTFVVAGGVNITSQQIISAIKSADVSITACVITISNTSAGIDKLNFKLETLHQSITKNTLALLEQSLKNMSIDFNDVVTCGQVVFVIDLKKQEKTSHSGKFMIKIYDLRKYER